MPTETQPRVAAVCVVHEIRPGFFHDTAIDKRPVEGPVTVHALGLEGDTQIDSSHGGPDGAVYVYAAEDAEHFSTVLGRDVPPGLFGENVRTTGLDVTGALIGERWRIGDVELEVRKPRTPCKNLAQRVGVEDFHLDFNKTGRVGALCKVIIEGTIQAGDGLVVLDRPDHLVSVGVLARGLSAEQARSLLDSQVPLAAKVRAKAQRVADRGTDSAAGQQ